LVACRVLEDKNVINKQGTASEALQAAQKKFSENINPGVLAAPGITKDLVVTVFNQLRSRFAFSSLTTEMLGHLYENALVTPEFRQEHGIYYTPRAITKYILSHLPIESIPEEKRVLMDPCCGSGSFLLAGFDRLVSLLPNNLSSSQAHQYLRTRLIGMDIDEFAVETAVLSLVVRDPMNRNGWNIKVEDVQELTARSGSQRPAIVVTNPPFREIKEGGKRKEFAAEVFMQAITAVAPGGLIGIVLPQSILDSRSAANARDESMKKCDILEILTLPGGLFYSNADTAVMMMRKKTSGVGSSIDATTVRELHSQDLPRFRSAAGFTVTYSVERNRLGVDPEHRFILSPLADLWERLERNCHCLKDFAIIRSGIQVKKDDKQSVSHHRRHGDVKFVNRLDAVRAYALLLDIGSYRPLWLKYGSHLRRAGDQTVFEAAKVLLSSNRNPGTPWRLIAAPGPPGLYFSDNFHGVIPKDGDLPIHVLTAILNSPLANAWFHAHCRKRKVVQATLGELPVPDIDKKLRKDIETLAQHVEKAAISSARKLAEGLFYEGSGNETDPMSFIAELDQLIYSAYNLSSVERRDLDLFMANSRRPI
jgi:predicted RNA methylase